MKTFLLAIKDQVDRHFEELILSVLFLATVGMTVHLMHKSDAGGNDAAFIVWAEAQAAFILGRLSAIIGSGRPVDPQSPGNQPPKEIP